MSTRNRIDWSEVPYVYVQAPTCPCCGSLDYERTKTHGRQGDGSTLRKVICRDCGAPYKIVIELPETGIEV